MSILIKPKALASHPAGASPFTEALKSSLEAYELDDPDSIEPFSARLAREQGWTLAFAQRTVREYKRFVFLAVSEGQTATPSDAVDQVWHQHLTYTRDYWGPFCGRLLGRPLHHQPSAGGLSALAAHRASYAETIAAYQRVYGERPPGDVWPSLELRFGPSSRFERVEMTEHLVIPIRRSLIVGVGALLLGGTLRLFVGQLAVGGLVAFSSGLWCAALLAACLLPRLRVSRARRQSDPDLALSPYEAAWLSGGERRLVQAGFGTLLARGALKIESNRRELSLAGALPPGVPAFEQAIYLRLRARLTWEVQALRRDLEPAVASIESRLRAHGLTRARGSRLPLALALAVPLLAVARLLCADTSPSIISAAGRLAVLGVLASLLFVPRIRPGAEAAVLLERLRGTEPACLEIETIPIAIALRGESALRQLGLGTAYILLASLPHDCTATPAGDGCGTIGGCGSCGGCAC